MRIGTLAFLLVVIGLVAAEYRVPLGLRHYDNSRDWFLQHEDLFPLAGEAVDNLAEFSVSLWVRVAKYPEVQMSRNRAVATLYSRGWSQELWLTAGGELLHHYCTSQELRTGSVPLRRNIWTHLVATYSVAQRRIMTYVDGRPRVVLEGALEPVRSAAKGFPLTVGQSAQHWNPFDGSIADLRWYDHPLSEEEVMALFMSPPSEIVEQLEQDRKGLNLLEIHPVAAPLGSGMILPQQAFADGEATANELHITLAPDEYEPGALVLRAPTEDLHGLLIALKGPLTTASGAILPVEAVDFKYVQCWFQAGSAWKDISAAMDTTVLVPELLVNDPTLVTVDWATGRQYVKLGGVEGVTARDIHAKKRIPGTRWDLRYPVTENDIRDAKTLQPLDLHKGMNRELFVTVHAAAETAPGDYAAAIEFSLAADGRLLATIPFKVTVLPIQLASPRLAYDLEQAFIPSIYYVNGMSPGIPPEITPHRRSEEQIAAELVDLKAHGIDNPFNYQLDVARFDFATFRKMLQMRKAAGLSNHPALLVGPEGNLRKFFDASPASLADLRQKVKDIIAVVKEECGHAEVYFYGVDEAQKEKVEAQRLLWEAIHEAGGRVMTSDSTPSHFTAGPEGRLIDIAILAHGASADAAARRHAVGGKVFSYCNPQGGVENPMLYRRNYGISLWKANYDGFATYCYYDSFGHPWDDFDSLSYRDHNLVYPTADGVVDTLAWEGFREAVDDIRYASTLAIAIRDNPAHPQAAAARDFLDKVTGNEADLDALRQTIVNWILKLQK